jgi:hypothetical protein
MVNDVRLAISIGLGDCIDLHASAAAVSSFFYLILLLLLQMQMIQQRYNILLHIQGLQLLSILCIKVKQH